jgi:SAM-dependent methyltransferase
MYSFSMGRHDYEALNAAQTAAEFDPFSAGRYRQFSRHLSPAARTILDAGCANGRGGAVLKALRPEIALVGLDCVQDRLDRLPVGVYDDAMCSYASQIDLPDGTFDAVLAGEFIEHLTFADCLLTLAEFHRLLRDSGQLLMTTPFPDYVRLKLTGGSTLGGAHLSAHYPVQLAAMMTEVGFTDIGWCGSGRMSLVLGERFPAMSAYGSFMIWGKAARDAGAG